MLRGLLDLIDHVDRLLGEPGALDGEGSNDPAVLRAALRRCRVREKNARLGIQEIRRRIERVGQETKT